MSNLHFASLADYVEDFEIRGGQPVVTSDLVSSGIQSWKFRELIRKLYDYFREDILSRECIDPYFVDWTLFLTPIEKRIWSLIRTYGIPMFPQYPVGRFFLDFGDPVRKIAIECDGAKWHDPKKDKKRDTELSDLGWKVYRIQGSECMKNFHIDDILAKYCHLEIEIDEIEIDEWYNTGEGVFVGIIVQHYGYDFLDRFHDDLLYNLSLHAS